MMGLQDNEAVVNSQEFPMRNSGSRTGVSGGRDGHDFVGSMSNGQMMENDSAHGM